MNAINSLPINAPVAPAPRPRAEASSQQDSQSASFENLLEEKSTPAGDQAACVSKAPRPDKPAEVADETNVPDNADFSTLLGMFPIVPILPTLPLQVEASGPAELSETECATASAAPATETLPAGEPKLPTAMAAAPLAAPAVPLRPATSFDEVSPQPVGAAAAGNPLAKPTLETELPPAVPIAATVVTPAVTPATRPSAAAARESFAVADPAPEPAAAKVSESVVVVTAAQVRREVRGTDVAMQERVMPDPLKSPAPEPKMAALAAESSARDLVAGSVAPQAEIRVVAPAGQQNSAGERHEEKPTFRPQTSEAPAPASTVASSFAAPAAPADEPAAAIRTQTETIIHRTMDAAERLRVTGGERVEVQIKLDAGQALTVRLQLIHGEVKPIFLTDSHELRQALEQNWSQFSDRGADRNVRVTTPVFESPNAQSGMNDLNQQQREGRQRAFADAQEAAFAAGNPTGRILPRRANAPMPAAAPATGVQLYA